MLIDSTLSSLPIYLFFISKPTHLLHVLIDHSQEIDETRLQKDTRFQQGGGSLERSHISLIGGL